MYSKQEISRMKTDFWTRFGQYMKPVRGAEGDVINWVNYKTGAKDILVRMEVENGRAGIGIEIRNSDRELQAERFENLFRLKSVLKDLTGEDWEWKNGMLDDNGREISYVGINLDGVSIMNKEDWPVIISFLKPRLIALDSFWVMVKDQFRN